MKRRVAAAALAFACPFAFADSPMPMSSASMNDAMQMDDDTKIGMIKFDQLDYAFAAGHSVAWQADAWYGGDFDKLWLRSEGEHEDGRLDVRAELFWDHAFDTFWDWQLGARHDAGLGASRDWAAFGVRGLAPYWFEVEATAYVGEEGRTAARVRTEYEILLTQRWILQPELEMNFYGKDDARRENGAGLSDADIGLRLRYEFRHELAPYVGIVWRHRFGAAARFGRADGFDAGDAQFVAGVRFWF